MADVPVIAFAGNPNSGKTSLFNALTGAHQHVANYPGVTVDVKHGRHTLEDGTEVRVLDLPGTYSLTAYSAEEKVARQALTDHGAVAIVCVVDASNLERNLYLLTQVAELGIPVVVALNMMDEAERMGLGIDLERLEGLLGMPVVPTVGRRGEGARRLIETAARAASNGDRPKPFEMSAHVEEALAEVVPLIEGAVDGQPERARFLAIKLLERDPELIADLERKLPSEALDRIDEVRADLEAHLGDDPEILVADDRYGIAAGITREVIRPSASGRARTAEKVDSVLTNRILGLPILLLMMWALFEGVFRLGAPLSDGIELGFGWLASVVSHAMPDGPLRSLVVDGVISGVGGVLVFIPQVLLLFLGISIMEDTGYLARAAFVVDRIMHTFGLHGKSFIPMLLGFGCSVPAVMATRILNDPKDRLATILVIPWMSCSARLPVYALLIGVFFRSEHGGLVLMSLYLLGVVLAVIAARVFRGTLFKGESAPFVMELPPYRMPTARAVVSHMWERAWLYVQKAGTTILAMSVLMWALSSFPKPPPDSTHSELEYSIAGRAGKTLEPAMQPAGFDWKLTVALFTGLAAKEVVVSSLSTIYGVKADAGEEGGIPKLRESLRQDPAMSPLVAYGFMVFVLLYIPCVSTVVIVAREAGGWKWAGFLVLYTTIVAWVVAAIIHQAGRHLLGL
jgi:ferrous iron transport protein B